MDHIYSLLTFQADRFFSAWCFILWLILLFGAPSILTAKHGRWLFWGGVVVAGCIGVVLTLSLWGLQLPHGLSAKYFANASWSESPMKDRYFENEEGQRVDRFLDFHPNDFRVEYPFSGRRFSVLWEGSVFVPSDNTTLSIRSNFDTWLSVDGDAEEIRIRAPERLDIGTADSRPYLERFWSFNEQSGEKSPTTFVWAMNDKASVNIGVWHIADYTLYFRCLPFTFPGSPHQTVRVFLERHELGSITLQKDWHTYSLAIPASVLRETGVGTLNLTFTFSSQAKPSDIIKGSEDSRELAAAFDMIEVRPDSPLPEFHRSPLLKAGVHHIKIRARSVFSDPWLQLVWQHKDTQKIEVVPENVLFPQTQKSNEIVRQFQQEYTLLVTSIIYKCLLLVFWLTVALLRLVPRPSRMRWRKESVIILGIWLFAFAIRLIFLFDLKEVDPHFSLPTPGSDHATYVFMARGFFRGYWPGLTHEPFYFSPLIAFYMISLSMLFGEHLIAVRVVTAILGACGVVLAYLITKRAINQTVAYIAAALCACNGVLIFYDVSLLSDPLVVFFNLATLWLMLKWYDELSVRRTVLLGIVLGLTALSRGTLALLMPFFFIWMLTFGQGKISRKLVHFVLLCIVTAAVISPVTVRNYFSSPQHLIVPTNTAGGMVLWANNNPSANGAGGYDGKLLHQVRQKIRSDESTYGQAVREYIFSQPFDYLRLEVLKLKLFLRGYEICDNLPYYIFRHTSTVLGLPWVNFVLIAPLGVLGLFLARHHWKMLAMLYGFVGVQVFSSLMFNAASRYRLPVIPAFSIFAAYAGWDIVRRIRQKQGGRVLFILVIFAALYIGFNYHDAARLYLLDTGEVMPIWRLLRYWDLFYTW